MTSARTTIAGRYRVEEPLGQGGMGRVWLGHDEKLNRTVALKELRPVGGLTADDLEELRVRALREARAAARLNDPHVVRVYDIVVEDGVPWIVMQYVPSRSLFDVVSTDGPLSPQRAAQVGVAVLAALTAAHRVGILHRDVKPGNVLVADDGRVVLTDFGLATIAGDPAITRSGVIIGSPSFMAPERAASRSAGAASDLWSLGATLYFAVEGRPPYDGESVLATLSALATVDPAPPVHSGPLRPVIEGLLRRDPADRLPAAQVGRLLRAAATPPPAAPTVAVPTVAAPTVVAPTEAVAVPAVVPPRRSLIALVVMALLAVVGAAAVWLSDDDGADPEGQPTSAPTAAASRTGQAPGAPDGGPTTVRPTPAESGTERPSGSGVPPGWRMHVDPTGFAVAVPADWTVSQRGSIVYFNEPGGGRLLGIDQTDNPKPDPVADWQAQEAYRVARGDFPGYVRVRLTAVDYFDSAADWEFTYLSGGTRLHVNNRGFITDPTQAYGMWWSTPDSRWAESQADLAVIQRSFRPAG